MCKSKGRVGETSEDSANYMLLGAVVAGGAVSALVVNQVTKVIFKKDPPDKDGVTKSQKYAPFIKIGLGVAALMYSDNDYVNAAGLGMIAVGGTEALQASSPDLFRPLARTATGEIAPPAEQPATKGVGNSINLNAWAVAGNYDRTYDRAVAGNGTERAVAGGL